MSKFIGIEIDKLLHFSISGMLFLIFSAVTHNIYVGATLALIVGLAKEGYDFYFKGFACVRDLVADVAGIAMALICTVVI